jgi:hypothetical protein
MPILVTVVCVCVCVLKLRAKDFFFLFRVLGYVNTLFLCAHRPMQRPNRLVGLTNVRSREPQHRVARSAVHRDCPFLLGRKDNVEYLPFLLYLHKCKYNSTGQNTQGRERGILETRTRCRIVFLTLFSSWYFFSFVFLA